MFYILELIKDLSFTEAVIVFFAFALALMFALIIHEYMHAYVAVKQGDMTPKAYGRLTFNPSAHFDIVGLLCFIIVGFGWAKPVPINTLNFKNHRRGVVLVSLAGICANVLIAFFLIPLLILITPSVIPVIATGVENFSDAVLLFLEEFISISITINLFLALFNIIPIYPLDGFNFLNAFLRYDNKFVGFMTRYGTILLLILIFSGVLPWVLQEASEFIQTAFLKFWYIFF